MRNKSARNESGLGHILLLVIVVLIGAIGFVGWRVYQKNHKPLPTKNAQGETVSYDQKASRELTGGNCQGAGPVSIGPPMKLRQVGFILPYGLVVGGHVTPVDHQYYNGLNVYALRDTYDVIAPADGSIVNIQHRGNKTNTPPGTVDVPSSDEYRIVMAHTCSFLTYVDLVTSLPPNILAKLPAGHTLTGSQSVNVNIPITKGEVIGHIGGQTLDFAVWDLSKKLTGFVNPADYTAESWKIFTAPPSQYMDASIKNQVIAKYVRTAAPIDGKIDYDIDGKLIGNWFLRGTGGYHDTSNKAQSYWGGHLSIAPDFIDPSVYNFSIGNYGTYPGGIATTQDNNSSDPNGANQFMAKIGSPDPGSVDTSSGLIKYELAEKSYILPSGQHWDNMEFAAGIKASGSNQVEATALVQLTAKRTLRFEVFPGKVAAQVSGFDSNAKIYIR